VKKIPAILFLSLCLTIIGFVAKTHAADLTLTNALTRVCFSPKGGCTDAIIKEISHAKTEILVQAYSFTSTPISKALVDAHKRGVRVKRF
jgi:phosphatidylserine/phosphatidylglycerophosphate/cardiolipin synthase-like enzyme